MAALHDIAVDPAEPASARVAASEALLNRAWSRPTQAIAVDEEAGLVQLVVSWAKS